MLLLSINTDKIIHALCWMLVHSLWQGLLLALVAGIIILHTKKTAAAVRYNLMIGALLLFITGIAVTFTWQLSMVFENKDQFAIQVLNSTVDQINESVPVIASPGETVDLIQSAIYFFNNNAAIIVWAWLLLLGLKSIRLVAGLQTIHRIKKQDVSSPGEDWSSRIRELTMQLGIRKTVRFLQSGIAKVPMVVGHLKPLILFPAGILAALPPAEIEAILVHELAHIRRRDYLVNLVQNIIEVFFFFNPAVLWVSTQIRTERENCCDDIAVAIAGNKRNYIQALLSFQEYNLDIPNYTPALADKKYHLLQRVKRIIYNNNKTLNAMEKTFLTAGVVIIGCSLVAFSPGKSTTKGMNKGRAIHGSVVSQLYFIDLTAIAKPLGNVQVVGTYQNFQDTVPATRRKKENVNGTIVTDIGGKHYEIVLEDNIITQLTIDGKKIPNDKIADYASLTDRIIAEAIAAAEEAKKEADRSKKQAENVKEFSERSKLQADESRKMAEMAKLQADKSMELSVENQIQAEISIKHAEQAKKEAEISLELAKENQKQAGISRERADQARVEAEKSMQIANETRHQAEESRKMAEQSRMEAEKMRKEIIQDLIKEKVINDEKSLNSLTLNNEELIVNGVKQPGALHKKFKEKYMKKGEGFSYSQ